MKQHGMVIYLTEPPKETKAERDIKADKENAKRRAQQREERDKDAHREFQAEFMRKRDELGMRSDHNTSGKTDAETTPKPRDETVKEWEQRAKER